MLVPRTKTLPVIVRVTSVGTDIFNMHKQLEQTLIRQLCKSCLILVCSVCKIAKGRLYESKS